jgi:hypothetical protein
MRRTAAIALLAIPCFVSAQSLNMKPGLWEVKEKPQMDAQRQAQMEKAQKALENMPPAQRQAMEQMMAQRGMSMGFAGGVVTVKMCVTPEQIARGFMPAANSERCTHDAKFSGNTVKTHFACTNPASQGDGVATFSSPTSYTSDFTMTHEHKGKTETTKVSGEGHWLGADCGNIKPIQSTGKS